MARKAERDLIRAVREALPLLREASEGLAWYEVHPRWAGDGAVFHDPALRLEAQEAAEEEYLNNLLDIERTVRAFVDDKAGESHAANTWDLPERWQTDDADTELE